MNLADYIKNQLPYWPNWINLFLLRLNFAGKYSYGFSYVRFKKRIETIQPERMLLDLVNYAIKHVPYYRNRYAHCSINSVDDFEKKIKYIDKDEVMAHWDEFLSDEIDMTKISVGTTGGTSGKSLKLIQPQTRYVWELAFMHGIWHKCGWNYNTRAVIRNHHLNGRTFLINPLTKEVIFDAFNTSDKYYQVIYKVIRSLHIQYVHSYPSTAFQFCKKCLELGLDLSHIKAFICGSEGITDVQNYFFKSHNITICTWYGHSEKLILAGRDTDSHEFIPIREYGFVETLPLGIEGEGELVGTTFYNYAFPLIRYKTGDHAHFLHDIQGNLILKHIVGRWDKSVIYKCDGTYTSLTALNLHNNFLEHVDGIQYIQEKVGFLKILVIKNKLYTMDDEKFIKQHVGKAMGGWQYVTVEYTDKLIFQPNGKFLPLISMITN